MNFEFLGYSGGMQRKATSNTSILIRDKQTTILIDASSSPGHELLKRGVDPNKLSALLLTHAHIDHIYAYPSLIHNLWLSSRKDKLKVIGNPHTLTKAKELLHLFKIDEKKELMEIEYISDEKVEVEGLTIYRFDVFHRPNMPTSGFVLENKSEKLAYFPDSVAMRPYPNIAINSTCIIHECGGLEKDKEKVNNGGHTTSSDAALLAKEVGCKNLYLTHLPEDVDGLYSKILEEARSIFPNTHLAQLNKVIHLS